LHPDEAARLGVSDGETIEITGPAGRQTLAAALDDAVPAGSVFVPYAQAGLELNRLGMPAGAGLRVRVTRAAVAVGA
jgi:anaerobic selenocysteine-containing dehydrogenase